LAIALRGHRNREAGMKLPIVELNGYRADIDNDVLVVNGETAKGTKVALEIGGGAIGPLALMLLQAARDFPRSAPGEGTVAQPLNLDDVEPVLLGDGSIGFRLTMGGALSVVVAPSEKSLAALTRCLPGPDDEDPSPTIN